MIKISSAQPRFIAADLFCGAGGATRGLIDAGGYVAAGVDIQKSCRLTYESNNPNAALDGANPRLIAQDAASDEAVDGVAAEVTRARAMSPSAPLGIALCAPCQPFTRIQRNGRITPGRQNSYKRNRSLLMASLPHIQRLKPDFIISENVSNLASPPHSISLIEFIEALTQLGYSTAYKRICASKFGAPQLRKRVALIAIRAPNPPRILDKDPLAPILTVRDAIGALPPIQAGETHPSIPNHRSAGLSKINKLRLRALGPGESNAAWATSPYGDIRPEFQKRRSWTDTFKNVGARVSADKPAPAITTKFFNMMCGRFGHYSQLRALSLREGAALQGFPMDYVFHSNSLEATARMIGNAAPPPLIARMALIAIQTIEDMPVSIRNSAPPAPSAAIYNHPKAAPKNNPSLIQT